MQEYTLEDLNLHVRKMRALYARQLQDDILVEINNPPPPGLPSPNRFYPDTEKMFAAEMGRHQVRKQFKDDFFPSVSPGNVGMLLPAFLGATPVFSPETGQLWVEPIPDLYDQLDKIEFDSRNRWLRETLERCDTYRAHLPEDCLLVCTTQGPDDVVKGLRGTDLFFDFIDRPQDVQVLFARVADFLVEYRRQMLGRVTKVEDGHINWQGFWVPNTCFSMTVDEATNYSPEMFDAFTAPAITRIVQAVGGAFDIHLEGSAFHVLDSVANLPGLQLLEYTNNPKWPRGIDMLDRLRSRLGDLPLKLLLTKQEFLEGMRQRILPGNCIYAVGYDVEHLTDAIASPEEAREIMREVRAYRPPSRLRL